ncbi:MAG: glycosyltransferase [Pseudomonadales bacterium]|nr:glycosyltransferase [Pseudomonadales bacterium]
MIVLFWLGAFLVVYSYLLYPLLLTLLQRRGNSVAAASTDKPRPTLTVIITARNEQARIAGKLDNTTALQYPGGSFDILVASDASTDATDEIVGRYAAQRVRLVRAAENKGKEHAQWLAIQAAEGEVLVFTDTATQLNPDALALLAENFSNPDVGAVSSEDELVSADGSVRGEGAYVRYEMALRRMESRAAGLVGLSGSCFAVRKSVCARWRTDTPSDITTALLCAQAGLRAVCDERVKGRYQDLKDESKEFGRKKRTIIRGMTAVWELREALNPFAYGLFSLQVWSHKILRWLVPVGLILALVTSAALALMLHSPLFKLLFALQLCGYVAAWLAQVSAAARRILPLRIGLYFLVANLATAAALWDFLRGVRIVTWSPSQR